VRSGLIDEKLFLQGHWYNVLLYWKLLQTSIAVGRKHRPSSLRTSSTLLRGRKRGPIVTRAETTRPRRLAWRRPIQ
jgi:hypothetical protein